MSPKRKQLRLIGYIRVSRVAGRAGDSFQSPGVQRERIEAYASGRGHVLIDVLEEFDESGRNPGRPLFQQALEIVERGDADGIMVARLDRFARSIVDALHAIQRLDAVGGQLIVEDLGLDTTTHGGRLVRNVMLALAEFELERITDNWMTARSHAVARGVQISATPIFGYTRGPDGRLEVDALTAPVVQAIFARRAAGQSLAAITRWLNAEHPSPAATGSIRRSRRW